jgi:hypothetical protein
MPDVGWEDWLSFDSHSREGGNPSHFLNPGITLERWIPAFAGMTQWVERGLAA